MSERNRSLEAISFVKDFESSPCTRCSLHEHDGNNHPVIGRGNINAPIMLIGEAPGKEEQARKTPFVGPAGQLLDRMFTAIDIDTNKDMYITNVVWCRPVAPARSGKQNYTPRQEQIEQCWKLTQRLVGMADPKILIACGAPAMKSVLGLSSARISDYEGEWVDHDDRKVFVMRHPASILHLSSDPGLQRAAKKKVWGYLQYFRDSYKQFI